MGMLRICLVALHTIVIFAKERSALWQCFGALEERQPYASIYTSLGCPFRCSFCCINAPFEVNRYRMRKPDSVVSEIQMLNKKYGIKTFKIIDEMLTSEQRASYDLPCSFQQGSEWHERV